jgi:phage terminase small subunit
MLCDEYDGIRIDPVDGASRDRYRRLLVEFGLTPSSRSRLKAPVEAPVDHLAELLKKQGKRKA